MYSKITAFWDVIPNILIERYRHFSVMQCLHIQSSSKTVPLYQTTWDHNPEEHKLNTVTLTISNIMHFVYHHHHHYCLCVHVHTCQSHKTFYKITPYFWFQQTQARMLISQLNKSCLAHELVIIFQYHFLREQHFIYLLSDILFSILACIDIITTQNKFQLVLAWNNGDWNKWADHL
jgi:hypothetical protein